MTQRISNERLAEMQREVDNSEQPLPPYLQWISDLLSALADERKRNASAEESLRGYEEHCDCLRSRIAELEAESSNELHRRLAAEEELASHQFNDPVCADCDGTGITKQTELACTCVAGRAARIASLESANAELTQKLAEAPKEYVRAIACLTNAESGPDYGLMDDAERRELRFRNRVLSEVIDVIRYRANQKGGDVNEPKHHSPESSPGVTAGALAQARDAALEEAAKIAEDDDGNFSVWGEDRNTIIAQKVCGDIAAAIRALKTKRCS